MCKAETSAPPAAVVARPPGSNSLGCSVDPHGSPPEHFQNWHALVGKDQAIASRPASPPCDSLSLGSFHPAVGCPSLHGRKPWSPLVYSATDPCALLTLACVPVEEVVAEGDRHVL